MPKQTPGRTLGSERTVAARLAYERQRQGLTYDAVAKLMEAEGYPIQISALHKIEKGNPPRRVTLNEAIALAAALGLGLEELVDPIEEVWQRRALEVAKDMRPAYVAYQDSIMRGLRVYLEYHRLATENGELLDYMNNQFQHDVDLHSALPDLEGVALGDKVTQAEVNAVRWDAVQLWGEVLRLARKAARGEH